MDPNIEKYSRNVIIHSTFMIIFYIFITFVSYYNDYLQLSLVIVFVFSLVEIQALVTIIIGIFIKNKSYILKPKRYIIDITQYFSYYFFFEFVKNFTNNWNKESINMYRVKYNFDNYSDEEIKKKLAMGSIILLTIGIIQMNNGKKFYNNYLEKYINTINSNENFKNYSTDESKAIIFLIFSIFYMIFSSSVILYFVNLKRNNLNLIIGFIKANTIYGIISILLVIIGIQKKNASLIKNYKTFPWNKYLFFAYIIYMILYISNYFMSKNEKINSTVNESSSIIPDYTIIKNSVGYYFLKMLYKMPSLFDKYTNNIVENIKNKN